MSDIRSIDISCKPYVRDLQLKFRTYPCCKFPLSSDIQNLLKSVISNVDLSQFSKSKKLLQTNHSKFLLYMLCQGWQQNYVPQYSIKLVAYIYTYYLIKKYIPICDDSKLYIAISHLRSNHLLQRYNHLDNFVNFIADSFINTVTSSFKTVQLNPVDCEKLVYSLRTRLANSLRRLAAAYMQLKEEKVQQSDSNKVIQEIVKNISIYGNVPIPSNCPNAFLGLINIDTDMLEKVVFEVITIVGPTFNKHKFSRNISKFIVTKNVLKQLGISVTAQNIYCLVRILYSSIGGLS